VRLENGALTGDDPPTPARVAELGRAGHPRRRPAGVGVRQGPHPRRHREHDRVSLLGAGGRPCTRRWRRSLQRRRAWRLHYVTARELYNVAVAAMDGKAGDPSSYYDYRIPPPPVARP
jgi:hypothetical protein